jgi:hypothetical protein
VVLFVATPTVDQETRSVDVRNLFVALELRRYVATYLSAVFQLIDVISTPGRVEVVVLSENEMDEVEVEQETTPHELTPSVPTPVAIKDSVSEFQLRLLHLATVPALTVDHDIPSELCPNTVEVVVVIPSTNSSRVGDHTTLFQFALVTFCELVH